MCVVCPDWKTTSIDLVSQRQHEVQGCASEKRVVTQGLVASAEKWAGRWSLLLGLKPASLSANPSLQAAWDDRIGMMTEVPRLYRGSQPAETLG